MKLVVHIRRSAQSPWVQAFCPDLPGCAAAGRSDEQAVDRLRRRIADHLAQSAAKAPPGVRVAVIDV